MQSMPPVGAVPSSNPGVPRERRKDVRLHLTLRSVLTVAGVDVPGFTENVCATGARIRLPTAVEPGMQISAVFKLPHAVGDVGFQAEVVWAAADPRSGDTVAGLRFLKVVGPNLHLWKKMLLAANTAAAARQVAPPPGTATDLPRSSVLLLGGGSVIMVAALVSLGWLLSASPVLPEPAAPVVVPYFLPAQMRAVSHDPHTGSVLATLDGAPLPPAELTALEHDAARAGFLVNTLGTGLYAAQPAPDPP